MRDARAEHLETLRAQARFTVIALRKTSDLLERLPAAAAPAAIDQVRSQARAALRALRSTNQLLAQAAALTDDRSATGGTANGHRNTQPARLG